MKRTLIAIAITAMVSSPVLAKDEPPYRAWVGGFGQYYMADEDKPEPVGFNENGKAFGGEVGFRFTDAWALRLEASRLSLDVDSALNVDDEGDMFGIDLMYFLQDDAAYLFAGVREQNIYNTKYRLPTVGLGKHWFLSDHLMLVTEVNYLNDTDFDYSEFGLKLGLSYAFGVSSHSSHAASYLQDTPSGVVLGSVKQTQRLSSDDAGNAVESVYNNDTDGDGVVNAYDLCRSTPFGMQVGADGCVVIAGTEKDASKATMNVVNAAPVNNDLDNDGVLNGADVCPTTAPGVKVDNEGCEVVALNPDIDGDGVLNQHDQCANTPFGATINENGCEQVRNADRDGDGVFDHLDKCLGTAPGVSVQLDGCEIKQDKEVSQSLQVLFPNNSSIIDKKYNDSIASLATFMHKHEKAVAVIEGHTSAVGSEKYNQFLSERRARAVVHMLIHDFGINPRRLQAVGYGETRLKLQGDTEQAHAANRRIESKVTAFVKR